MYLNINDGDKILYLGALLKITGLTLSDIQGIVNNELKLDENIKPSEIRNFILNNSEVRTTLLRKLISMGITLENVSYYLGLPISEINANVDNFFYYINSIDFKFKNNFMIRNKMMDFLARENFRNTDIAEILDISYATVRAYFRK